jgi:aspartate beta-hydroxylase
MDRLELIRQIVATERPPIASDTPVQRRTALDYPGLRPQAFYDPGEFAWTGGPRTAFDTLREELHACLERRTGFEPAYPGFADVGRWAALWFYLYGTRYESNCSVFPKTTQLIERIPRLAGWACYSAVDPESHIAPHCGVTNAKLRLHCALQAEPGSKIRVQQDCYEWREGEIMIFDDSLVPEVWGGGHRPRIVLSLDFYHPDLTDAEVDFLRAFESTPSPLLKGISLRSKYRQIHRSFSRHPNARDADWVYGHAAS